MEDKIAADVEKFRDTLISSHIGNQILKIIWFGSTLKGDSQRDSDVDILIITADGEDVRREIADVLLDVQMKTRAPIEITTSSIDDLYPLSDYFLQNVLSYGKEVFSMSEEKLKISAARHYLALAQEYLQSSQDAISSNHYRLGLDGAYNAAELAVKGLLLIKIPDLPGSHGGIAQRFGELFIKTEELDRILGRKLNQALDLRNQARYKYTARISKDDAQSVYELATELINILENSL